MPLPERSNSSHPSSRLNAATADDTDGCVTTSSSAAAVTDPPRITARKAVNCVSVIAISLASKLMALSIAKVTKVAPGHEAELVEHAFGKTLGANLGPASAEAERRTVPR
jgi:hypothetical protein